MVNTRLSQWQRWRSEGRWRWWRALNKTVELSLVEIEPEGPEVYRVRFSVPLQQSLLIEIVIYSELRHGVTQNEKVINRARCYMAQEVRIHGILFEFIFVFSSNITPSENI